MDVFTVSSWDFYKKTEQNSTVQISLYILLFSFE